MIGLINQKELIAILLRYTLYDIKAFPIPIFTKHYSKRHKTIYSMTHKYPNKLLNIFSVQQINKIWHKIDWKQLGSWHKFYWLFSVIDLSLYSNFYCVMESYYIINHKCRYVILVIIVCMPVSLVICFTKSTLRRSR